jgi:ADP-ribose pyrophosphatase
MLSESAGRWEARVVETLVRNPWFGVLLQAVKRPDGSEVQYYTLDFPTPAVGVIVRRGGKYLLIRQHRFIVDQYVWAIPSGGVKAGEDPAEAAAREVLEETGYRVKSMTKLLYYFPSYGCSNQRFELFLADEVEEAAGERIDKNEVMGVRWFEKREVIEMMMANGIVDGLSLTPLAVHFLQDAMDAGDRSAAPAAESR